MTTSKFAHGTAYPIETLPNDLHDETIPNRDRWALRDAMFWNDCQGWWHEPISDYRRGYQGRHVARFWMPEPPAPMTREQILAELDMVVCPTCDLAIYRERGHECGSEQIAIVTEQRRLQAIADAKS